MRNILGLIAALLSGHAIAVLCAHDGGPDMALFGFLAPLAIGLGAKAIGGLFGKKKDQPSDTQNRYLAALGPQERRANLAEDYYLKQAMSFDPSAALREYGAAATGDFNRTVNREVADLGGRAVGAGRLDTGFYDLDQGELVSDIADRYQRDLASKAMEAAGMDLNRIQGVGAYGQGTRNTYLDLLAGQLDRETGQKNAKRDFWGNVLGSTIGAAGTVAGAYAGR